MKGRRTSFIAAAALAVLISGIGQITQQHSAPGAELGLAAAQAQIIGQRAVFGTVVNADSAPLASAVVFIKNLKTKSIRSYTTAADGKFRFAQIAMNEDHEVWAEKDGKKSAPRTVSTWDTRSEFGCELRVK